MVRRQVKSNKKAMRSDGKKPSQRRHPTREQLEALAEKMGLTEADGLPITTATRTQLWAAITDEMYRREVETDKPTPGGDVPTGTEMSLIRKACHGNYQIPDDELNESPAQLRALAADTRATRRDRIMAIRTLLAMREFTLSQANSMMSAMTKGIEEETTTRVVRTPFQTPPK